MKGLKVFLAISCVFFLVLGLASIFWPTTVANMNMGPKDVVSSRYDGAIFLALSLASMYAYRNPKKNVAIVNTLILGYILNALVSIWSGISGDSTWVDVVPTLVICAVIAAGFVIFYPRGEKPV